MLYILSSLFFFIKIISEERNGAEINFCYNEFQRTYKSGSFHRSFIMSNNCFPDPIWNQSNLLLHLHLLQESFLA